MSALPDKLFVKEARQGGFTAVQLPGPLEVNPLTLWGLGWVFEENPQQNGGRGDTSITGICGDGSSSASFVVRTGSSLIDGSWLLPIRKDVHLVVFSWRVKTSNGTTGTGNLGNVADIWEKAQTTNTQFGAESFGVGRKCLILSNTTVAIADVTESLADYLWGDFGPTSPVTTGKKYSHCWGTPSPTFYLTPNVNGEEIEEIYDIASAAAPSGAFGHAEFNGFPVLANSGGFYEDVMPDGGGDWRIDLSAVSGFAEAKTQAPIVGAADSGSVWFKNYDDWDGKPYYLQRFIDGSWQQWTSGVSLSQSVTSISPEWFWNSSSGESANARFVPCISIPFTDRTAYFQSEFGMTV
jgi:hypothetical protein